MKPRYLFGDSDIAARRLNLLAEVFAESTRGFLRRAAAQKRFALVLDLGCGPGFTTHLIADTIACERVIGLEASPRFVEIARSTMSERVGFELHDVLTLPFPMAPADLIFCRFLVTHLEDPAGAIAKWATQLSAGGQLMIEEVEAIRTANPVFARYAGIVEAMLASQRNYLYAGPIVAAIEPAAGIELVSNEVNTLAVRNCDAARMFAFNLRVWKDGEFVRTHYSSETISEIEAALEAIARDESPASEIQWDMRQMVFRRAA